MGPGHSQQVEDEPGTFALRRNGTTSDAETWCCSHGDKSIQFELVLYLIAEVKTTTRFSKSYIVEYTAHSNNYRICLLLSRHLDVHHLRNTSQIFDVDRELARLKSLLLEKKTYGKNA